MRNLLCGFILALMLAWPSSSQSGEAPYEPSFASQWLDIMQDVAGNEIQRAGARPTIISRQMGLIMNAMYDAWACYDDKAVGLCFGGSMRRPPAERTLENKKKAIAYAMYRMMLDVYPNDKDLPIASMKKLGYRQWCLRENSRAVHGKRQLRHYRHPQRR